MAREAEKKMTRTSRHFLGDTADGQVDFTQERVRPLARPNQAFIGRLSWLVTPKGSYDAVEFAKSLARHPGDPYVFVDSSLFDDRTDLRVWHALLNRHRGITLTPAVQNELSGWLEGHPNHPAAQAIRLSDAAVDLRQYDTNSPEESVAMQYYVNLLGVRKRLFRIGEIKFESEYGRPPTSAEQEVLRREMHEFFGARAYLLGKKGRAAEGSRNLFTDEKLVYAAIATALRSGRPTYILTKDEDIQEQFYKLMWLLDTHYRGMLLASAFSQAPTQFRTTPMPMTDLEFSRAFTGENNILVERSDVDLSSVLPEKYTFVDVHCCVLGELRTEMTFGAEREMAAILHMKGATNGRSTDLFGRQDCHVWLAPLDVPAHFRGYAAIAHSHTLDLPGTSARISLMDVEQSLFTGERFGRTVDRESPWL